MKKKYIAIAVACIGLAGIFGNNNDSAQPKQETVKVETASAVSEKPAKTVKPMTMQQRALKNADGDAPADGVNALKKGILYAESMHMSKAGVYDQLVSEYGEKFSPEAAKWAVDHMSDIDWNKAALEKAKSYQKNMSMSREAIREQLASEHGEKFTAEEADYAVKNL